MHTANNRSISSSNKHHHHSNIKIPHHQMQSSKDQQPFTVIYNGSSYEVDPIALSQSSTKFKEIIKPYIQNSEEMKKLHLEIHGNQFTKRNINNFLRLCQKLPTDVQDSEMKEICEIARLFKANEIYNTGIAFIKSNIDPSFNVPENKYDGTNSISYLSLEGLKNLMDDSDSSDDFFKDLNNNRFQGKYYQINENKNNNSAEQVINSKSAPSNKDKHHKTNQVKTNVIYKIKIHNHSLKCLTFKFYRKDEILFTAKQKQNEIFFADGNGVHISQKEAHIAHIIQNMTINTVFTKSTRFNVKYVNTGANHYSIETSFPLEDDKITNLVPRKPTYDKAKDRYFLNLRGEYNHKPVPSIKNILLEDEEGKATLISRKMGEGIYEIECLPTIEPLIAFCLGVSDIVGPYDTQSNTEI